MKLLQKINKHRVAVFAFLFSAILIGTLIYLA